MPDQLMAKNLDTGEFCRADLLAVSWGDFSCGGGKGGRGDVNWACRLAAIAGATILVPCHVVKSLQLIWRSGTRRWNLRVPNLQMSCIDLI